ncbi:hypothetical protein MCBMB27_00744 [Methylobacterium phyllosphaerae]|uniref:Uncharacterized protein n=1 Tax=Methylobacterium phyllosphaerae TaxID=418223 RepID=A0AAE8HUY3_9HYPH|nr:hypothetical protein [Methylobacterium phyllosphaerae]APT30035.1 hypothetical protein MCBMB27_00744 [Methylobacterium phyllosphaerae]SFH32266.1 hypothetical protein SAMN05192567_12044 [Methylobacterium phyllosphaerae]
MPEPVTTTTDTTEARPVPRWRLEPETYSPRVVDREIAPWLHQNFRSATNFRGDVEIMLQIGEHFGLTERDLRFLLHLLKTAIRHAESRGDEVVSLSDRQWHIFKSIRRRFIRSYCNVSTFMNYLKAIRGADHSPISSSRDHAAPSHI